MIHPIKVMTDGLDVVCDTCGAVWVRALLDTDTAVLVAEAMNSDSLFEIPEAHKAQKGVCHGVKSDPVDKPLPPEWEQWIAEREPEHVPWYVFPLAVLWGTAQVPKAFVRLAQHRNPVPFLLVGVVGVMVVTTPGLGSDLARFVLNAAIVLGVAVVVSATAWFCWTWSHRAPTGAVQPVEQDATVIKPITTGSVSN